MSYQTFKLQQEVEFVDIATMGAMSDADYREYLEDGLLVVDHHDILRSQPAGYPLAVTKSQFKALLRYLQELEPRIGEQ